MATRSFHQFPRLPTELRLKIWGDACDVRQPNQHGVHYVDFDTSTDGALLLASSTTYNDAPFNSACLVDAGLWTACKESREVMVKHMNAVGRDGSNPWVKMLTRGVNGNLNGHCFVCPTQDIFCLRPTDWNIVRGNSDLWQVGIQNTGLDGQTSLSIVNNIALEFDESWVTDLPRSYYDLMAESSARGLLSRLLYNTFLHSSPKPTIWLMDRDTLWSRPGISVSLPLLTYFDDSESHVQAYPHVKCSTHGFDERSEALPNFLNELDEIGMECERDHSEWYNYHGDIFMAMAGFQITEDLKFLASPNNQVELCRKDHRPVFDHEKDEDEDMGF